MRHIAVKAMGILAVVGATGCGSPVAPTIQERLEGSWTWVESSGGIAGETRTPESTGETMTLRFVGDSVELLRDGVSVGATTFQIGLVDDGGSTVIEYEESILGFGTQSVVVSDDELLLIDPCCDGFAYGFVRAD